MRCYHVYIMTNHSRTLYTGVTSNLVQRVRQHKNHAVEGFTSRYKIDRLVYCEAFANVRRAIAREKEIKGWLRVKKLQLIVSQNPEWRDLAADWHKEPDPIFAKAKA
jgi:putative endonuclease